MPDVQAASIDFLANIDLYAHEKPYVALVSLGVQIGDDELNNLKWETRDDITINDVRGSEERFSLTECGSQLIKHTAKNLEFSTREQIDDYKQETQALLKGLLGASRVHCWETRV